MIPSSMPLLSEHTSKAAMAGRPPPTRHGQDVAAARQAARRLRWMIKGNPDPDEQSWQRLGQALWQGDPPADELVEWMHAQGLARAWPLFERALAAPHAMDDQTPAPLRAYIHRALAWPQWADPERMARGAHALQSTGLHGMIVLRDAGLMAGYQAGAINQTLVKTGALHKGAARRVAETTAWWLSCIEDGGMAPGAKGFNMTLRVRLMHALVRHQLVNSPDWDADQLGLPVNQLDMQATYLAFSVVQLLSLRTTGVWMSDEDANAVMHLWRYIGWLMGVREEYLCDEEMHGRVLLYQNVLSQAPADESSVQLGRALMDEPLQRHYPNAKALRGRFNKARHLSLVRWFVGRSGMRALGLPPSWPWYPALVFVPFMAHRALLHAVPALRAPWRRWAGQRQRDYLRVMMGDQSPPPHLTGHRPGAGAAHHASKAGGQARL